MKKIGCVGWMILLFASCSDYLNVVPDNTLTLEDIFTVKEDAYNALAKLYNGIPRDDNTHLTTWTLGDEWVGRLDLNNNTGDLRAIRIMRGLQSATDPQLGLWSGTQGGKHMYRAIRQTDVFLANIDKVADMTEQEKAEWKAQAKCLKAYFAFLLVQKYGPIVIPTEMVTPDATSDQLFLPRSKVEDCFNFIIDLLDEATPDLVEKVALSELGQIDQIVAKAIKAKVLFYRASPFYNGNREYFGDFLDHDGQPFFPLTYDKEKWKQAIDAINDALNICSVNGIRLYTYEKEPFIYDREDFDANPEKMQTLYDLRMVICDPWNSELVWGYSGIDYYNQGELAHSTNMRLPSGFSGVTNTAEYSWQWMGATYQMVERYYTKNGLPITEDRTFDVSSMYEIIETPGMMDPEYADIRGIMQPREQTIRLYMDREPRFYANLGITGGYWRTHSFRIPTMMFGGAYGGYNSSQHSTDFFCTGIGIQKFVHPESTSGAWQRTIKYPYPIIRLADLYLMKAEALNEYNDAPTQEVYNAINLVRERAGIPRVESVWADATLVNSVNKHRTKEGMRDIILQERSIELAFEGSHFWDMLRHKKAASEFSAPIWGWTHTGTTAQTFFVLEVKQARKFTITDCLWPISLNEMNTNGELIQNPGW
ncbi:RagB/SusD family nutrient uptake outer membrane protein, partial [termite gut metagenome]